MDFNEKKNEYLFITYHWVVLPYITYVKKVLAQDVRQFLSHLETTPESKNTRLESEFDALSEYVSNASFLWKLSELWDYFSKELEITFENKKVGIFRNY